MAGEKGWIDDEERQEKTTFEMFTITNYPISFSSEDQLCNYSVAVETQESTLFFSLIKHARYLACKIFESRQAKRCPINVQPPPPVESYTTTSTSLVFLTTIHASNAPLWPVQPITSQSITSQLIGIGISPPPIIRIPLYFTLHNCCVYIAPAPS